MEVEGVGLKIGKEGRERRKAESGEREKGIVGELSR